MAVDTETLFNQAAERKAELEAQGNNVDAQRRQLVQQLGSTRNRAQAAQIKAQISGLDSQRHNINSLRRSQDEETGLRISSAFRNTHLSVKALDDQRDMQVQHEGQNLMNGLRELEAKYPRRGYDAGQSDKFSTELAQLRNDNAFGLKHNKEISKRVMDATFFHDEERTKALTESAQRLAGFGLTPQQFASRDSAKDFRTNAKSLSDAEAKRADDGEYTVFTVGGKPHIIPSISFNHYDANFPRQLQADSTAGQTPGEVNYNVPATPPPKGTNYTFSGTETPNHPGDYWSEPQVNGLVTHHFASGGSATVADHTTTEGQELINNARQQTADRKQFLDAHPEALSGFGGGNIGLHSGQANIPQNVPAAPPVEPIKDIPAAANPNVLVQPYQMGDEKTGAKPSVQVNSSTATLPAGVQPIKPNPDAYIQQGRIEIARKALTDPNATEAHRVAARQILGIKEDAE